MDKEDCGIYIHSEIPLSHKKNGILRFAFNMDGFGGHYAK